MEKDRRREARTYIPRPVYVRLVEPGGQPFEEVRTMLDFSRDGLYFLTEQSCYTAGMELHVIPAFGTRSSRCTRFGAGPLRFRFGGEFGLGIFRFGMSGSGVAAQRFGDPPLLITVAPAAEPVQSPESARYLMPNMTPLYHGRQ
jgi:hypothetical protein